MTYLEASAILDYNSPEIQAIVEEFKGKGLTDKAKAIGVYLKIRDGWRYNPYKISFEEGRYRASYLAQQEEGHCIDKSILLVASLRALGVPARMHLAKVKNHIAVERLTEKFGTNELTPHGMVDVFIHEKWLKVSPAFNIELCEKCNVAPLDFDGAHDSVFHEFDREGNKFMAYLEDYGHFEDVPVAFIKQNFLEHYGAYLKDHEALKEIQL